MLDAAAVAQAYLETWNESSHDKRNAILRRHWTDDAHYVDPLMGGAGHAQISELVTAVHERFPGYRFSLLGVPDGHGDYVRLSWALGPQGGAAPIEGSDVVQLRHGQIQRVIGFIDKAPASAG